MDLVSHRLGEPPGSFRWDKEGKCGHRVMPESTTPSQGGGGLAEIRAVTLSFGSILEPN